MEGDRKVLYFKEQLNSVFKGIVYPEYTIMLIVFCKTTHFSTLVKNKYIYVILSVLQIHLHMYVLNTNPLQLCFWYTKLVYLKGTTNYVLNAL